MKKTATRTAIAIAVMAAALTGEHVIASQPHIAHVYRWVITEVVGGAVAPPLVLVWERSPIWFERWHPGGRSESPGRRIVETPQGLVTIMKRTLFLLDPTTGGTVWSRELPGQEVVDWKVGRSSVVLYSAMDYKEERSLKGAVDVAKRGASWSTENPPPRVYQHEQLIPTPDIVLYASDGDSRGVNDEIVARDLDTGAIRWRVSRDFERGFIIAYTSFVFRDRAYVLIGAMDGGLDIQSFGLSDGRRFGRVHIFGTEQLGNSVQPVAVRADGTLLIGYNYRHSPEQRRLLAFSLDRERLLWSTDVTRDHGAPIVPRFKHVVTSPVETEPVVATLAPKRFVTVNVQTGAILAEHTLPDAYSAWTEPNAVLYSFPYLFTSARRPLNSGMAYDFIALNVATGKVEWSYEIDTQRSSFSTASAEILNFIVRDNHVYVARADGKIMKFQIPARAKP